MTKWFEVTVTTVKVFAVEVEDDETEEHASKYATNEVSEFEEAVTVGPVVGEVEIDRLRRHADEVLTA